MKIFETKKIVFNIRDNFIEVLELSFVSNKGHVTNSRTKKVEKGVVEFGRIKNKEFLKKIIIDIFRNGNNGKFEKGEIYFLVQEDNVYSHILGLKNNNEVRGLDELINKKLPENIDKYVYKYKYINQVENLEEGVDRMLYFMAIKKDFINSWNSFFKEIGYKINCFIPKSSIFNLYLDRDENNVLFCDINEKNSSISSFLGGQVFYTNKINIFEDSYSIDGLNFKKINLSKESKDSSIFKELLKNIILEIEIAISHVKKISGRDINELFLLGTVSENKSIIPYLKKEIDQNKLKISLLSSRQSLKGIKTKLFVNYGLALSRDEDIFCFKAKTNNRNIFLKIAFDKNILKIILSLVFILVSTYLLFAFFSNSKSEDKFIKENLSYQIEDIFKYKILLSTDKVDRKNELKGRTYDIVFEKPIDKKSIYRDAKKMLSEEINEDEFYWEEPFENIKEQESIIFPLKTTWFIGYKKDLEEIVNQKVNNKIESRDYQLEIYKNDLVKKSIYEDLYTTNLIVKIEHNFDIKKYDLKEKISKRLIIVNSNNKKINIRKGPGTEFPIVAKAQEGEDYKYIRTLDSWANIILSNGEIAWISEYFTEILD